MLPARFVKTAVFVFIAVLVLAIPLSLQAASEDPSSEIISDTSAYACDNSANPVVNVLFNFSGTVDLTGSMNVPGYGVVAAYDQTFAGWVGPGFYTWIPSACSVPAGTNIALTVTTYKTDDKADGKAYECALVYQCDTGARVSLNCGPATSAPAANAPGPDMAPLPVGAVVGTVTANTALHFDDAADTASEYVMTIGQSLWVIGINEAGTFYKVLLSGKPYWVPVGSIGPTYDDVWNGTPLPSTVAD